MADNGASEQQRGGALSFVLTLFVPGLGHGIAGHPGRGAIWLLVLLGCWGVATGLALIVPIALLYAVALSALIVLAAAIDAARRPKQSAGFVGWLGLVLVAGVAFFVAPLALRIFLRLYVVEAFEIPSGGMCPTFQVGDHVFVDKTAYRSIPPARGDVVVHMATLPNGQSAPFVKRVVAIGGDEVRVSAGRVTVNGVLAPISPSGSSDCEGQPTFEEDLGGKHAIALDASLGRADADVSLRVPEGSLFLLGDNRMNSYDSRHTGAIEAGSVVGRASVVWLSDSSIVWRRVH